MLGRDQLALWQDSCQARPACLLGSHLEPPSHSLPAGMWRPRGVPTTTSPSCFYQGTRRAHQGEEHARCLLVVPTINSSCFYTTCPAGQRPRGVPGSSCFYEALPGWLVVPFFRLLLSKRPSHKQAGEKRSPLARPGFSAHPGVHPNPTHPPNPIVTKQECNLYQSVNAPRIQEANERSSVNRTK